MLERFALGLGGHTNCILDDVYPPEDYDEEEPDRLRYPATYTADTLEALDANFVTAQNVSIDSVRAVLDALPPTVVELDLSSSALNGNLLATIVGHPNVHRLRRLVLSACMIRDSVAPILVDGAPALANLERIELSRNALTRTTKQLSAALPNAVLDEQTDSGRPDFCRSRPRADPDTRWRRSRHRACWRDLRRPHDPRVSGRRACRSRRRARPGRRPVQRALRALDAQAQPDHRVQGLRRWRPAADRGCDVAGAIIERELTPANGLLRGSRSADMGAGRDHQRDLGAG